MPAMRTALLGAVCLAGALQQATAFTTTLHGGANEDTPVGTPGAATLIRQPWLTQIDPDAVCNDGSPAAYYFQKGYGSGANVWVMYLEGGFWCWDAESCNLRYNTSHFQMSSSDWTSTFAQEGIFSTYKSVNEGFYNANLAWVKYCSSDSWFGDAGPSATTFGYSFRGARIISAAVEGLRKFNGMGSTPGAKFLFSGCSAGGRGVMGSLEAVATQLEGSGIELKGMIDAAAWVDVQPPSWEAGLMSLQTMTAQVYAFSNPPIPPECAAKYKGEEWKCIWSSYRLPMISVPYFLNAAQFDAFQLMYDMDNKAPTDALQFAYVDSFQNETLKLFSELPDTAAILSSACSIHCLSGNADFYNFTVDGVSMEQAVNVWFFGEQSGWRLIEPCRGYDCTNRCVGGPWMPSNVVCTPTPDFGCGEMSPLGTQQTSINEALGFEEALQNAPAQERPLQAAPGLAPQQQQNMDSFVNQQEVQQKSSQ